MAATAAGRVALKRERTECAVMRKVAKAVVAAAREWVEGVRVRAAAEGEATKAAGEAIRADEVTTAVVVARHVARACCCLLPCSHLPTKLVVPP